MKLQDYLAREEISAAEFARRIGRAVSTVARILHGDTIPEPETLARIVVATGGAVQPNDFSSPAADAAAASGAAEEELMRARLYRLLARFLAAPPDRALLDMAAALEGNAGEFGIAVTGLARAAAATTPDAAAAEFHDLFIGVGRGELVPYGSYYMTGFLNEKPLARLRGDLAAMGIARAAGVPETEDGIAALCEVMAGLIDGAFGAPAELPAQRRFYEAHLAPWAGRFFGDLERAEAARLYAALGTLGRLFMAVEEAAFAMET